MKLSWPDSKLTQFLLFLAGLDALYALGTFVLLIIEKLTVRTTVTGEVLDVEIPVSGWTVYRPLFFVFLFLAAALVATRRDWKGIALTCGVWVLALGCYHNVGPGATALYNAYQRTEWPGLFLFSFSGVTEWDVVRAGLLLLAMLWWGIQLALNPAKSRALVST